MATNAAPIICNVCIRSGQGARLCSSCGNTVHTTSSKIAKEERPGLGLHCTESVSVESGHRQVSEDGAVSSSQPSGAKRKVDVCERAKNKKPGTKRMIQTTLRTVELTETATDNTASTNVSKRSANEEKLISAVQNFIDNTTTTDCPGSSNNRSQKVLDESHRLENGIRIAAMLKAKCLSEIKGSGFIVKQDGDTAKGGTIICTICHHYVHDSKFCKVKKDRGFAWGINYPQKEFAKFIAGGNKSWYALKHRMTHHLECSSYVGGGPQHFKALLHRQRNEAISKSMIEIARNLILCALTAIKDENPLRNYESLLGTLYACHAPIGDYGHGLKQFNEIVKTLCVYACIKTKELLSRKLPSTGIPPHFSTVSANNNHVVMILTMYQGRKISIPIAARALHNATADDEVTGETEANLAKQVIETLTLNLNLEGDMLSRLASHQADWQHDVASGFRQALISTGHTDCVPADWEKYLVVACDAAQWMDQCFTDVGENRIIMLRKFMYRCYDFLCLFGAAGREYVEYEDRDDKPELPLYIRAILQARLTTSSRFATSSLAIFQYIYSNYAALIATLMESPNYGFEARIFRCRDFAVDLCGVLDCLAPMINIMINLQSIDNNHIWDIVRVWPRLKQIMLEKIDELRNFDRSNGPDSALLPKLNLHWLNLSDKDDSKFHGQSLVEGWLRTVSKVEGRIRTTSVETYRYPEDSINDIRALTENLVDEFDARFEKCTPIAARELANCFDAHQAVTSASDSENWKKYGLAEFTNFFEYVCSLKHVRELACGERSLHLYPRFSEQAWILSRRAIHLVLYQDFANCRQKWFLCDSAERVVPNGVTLDGFEVSRRKSEIENEYKLKSGQEVYACRLDEREFYKTFYQNEDFFAAVGKEFCIALDVALNMGGSGEVVDSFKSAMESQTLSTGPDDGTLAQRAIVDWIFPAVPISIPLDISFPIAMPGNNYLDTVDEIAKLYRDGDGRYGLSKHRSILDVRGWKQRSIVNCLPQRQRSTATAFILEPGDS